jgi:hypothetical protein
VSDFFGFLSTMTPSSLASAHTESHTHGKRAVLNVAADPSRIAAANSAVSMFKTKPLPYTSPT